MDKFSAFWATIWVSIKIVENNTFIFKSGLLSGWPLKRSSVVLIKIQSWLLSTSGYSFHLLNQILFYNQIDT